MAYSHRVHGLMSNIPSVKCPCHDGSACGRSPELSALPAVTAWAEPWSSPGRVRDGDHGLSFRGRRLGDVASAVRRGAPRAGQVLAHLDGRGRPRGQHRSKGSVRVESCAGRGGGQALVGCLEGGRGKADHPAGPRPRRLGPRRSPRRYRRVL
jgi:hypothetical protein